MPVCSCGLKVERFQSEVQCILCHQIFHASCYNFKSDELDLVKSKFKCKHCSRRSLLSSPTIAHAQLDSTSRSSNGTAVVAALTDSNADELSNDSLVGKPVSSSADTNAFATDVVAIDTISANIIEIADNIDAESQSTDFSFSNACVSNSQLPNSKHVTMELLLAEILTIKQSYEEMKCSNLSLKELVISLVNDNTKLMGTVCEMSDEIKQLNNTLSHSLKTTVSSPKRKKSLSMNNKCLNTAKNLSTPLSEFPAIGDKIIDKPSTSLSFANVARLSNINANNSKMDNNNAISVSSPKLPEVLATSNTSAFQLVQSKNKKLNIVSGVNESKDLRVVEKKKWLHLSSFDSSVTAKEISAYIAKYAGIIEKDIECNALVKRDANLDTLKFINFKVGVVESAYNKVFNATLWPTNVKVRPFNFLTKADAPNLPV